MRKKSLVAKESSLSGSTRSTSHARSESRGAANSDDGRLLTARMTSDSQMHVQFSIPLNPINLNPVREVDNVTV